MTAIARHFFRNVTIDKYRWLSYHRFREAVLFEPSVDALLDIAAEEMAETEAGERQVFLYEIAFSLSYQAAHSHAAAVFETLWSRGVDNAALAKALTQATVTNLPPNYFVGRSNRDEVDVEESRERQRQDFDRDIEQIRSGAHMGWLKHLGMIYFAHYGDVDRAAPPRERLAAWLGQERTDTALEALMASLSRDDLPSYADVMKLAAQHQHYDWWNALAAGLNERWAAGQGLSGLFDDFLQGMLAFDITNPVSQSQEGTEHWIVHPWRQALMERRPELVRDVYLAVVRLRLSRNEQFSDGLRELLAEAAFEPYRVDVVLGLLREFPNASPFRLDELLAAAAKLPAGHEGFLELARQIFSGAVLVDQRQRDLWLATAYVLAPDSFEQDVQQRAVAHPDFIFDLRDEGGFGVSLPCPWLCWLPSSLRAWLEAGTRPALGRHSADPGYWLPQTIAALRNAAPATVADLHACVSSSAIITPRYGRPSRGSSSASTRMTRMPRALASIACSGSAKKDLVLCRLIRKDWPHRGAPTKWNRC
jgi:hypothetical protein